MTTGAHLRAILTRLEPMLGRSEGAPVALDGGITNRNYRARLGGEDYVIRLPGRDAEGEVTREPLFDPSGERIRG